MSLKISITGASGFIGSFLCKELTKKKFILQKIKRVDFDDNQRLIKKVTSFEADFFIHLASDTSPDDKDAFKNQMKSTIQTSIDIAYAIPQSTKLAIFFGSIEEYGDSPIPYTESNQPNPLSAYGWAKYSSYLAVKQILEKRKVPYLWLRPCLILGRNGSNKRLVGQLINSIDNKEKFNPQNPEHIRDLLYVDDLPKIIVKIIINYKNFRNIILNISNENYFYVKNLMQGLTKSKLTKIKRTQLLGKPGVELKVNSPTLFKKKLGKFSFTHHKKWNKLLFKNS
ncbi:WcaG Nucleoside-diphosphate-sugar epimerases [Candidatus Methylopumilus universalis]